MPSEKMTIVLDILKRFRNIYWYYCKEAISLIKYYPDDQDDSILNKEHVFAKIAEIKPSFTEDSVQDQKIVFEDDKKIRYGFYQ